MSALSAFDIFVCCCSGSHMSRKAAAAQIANPPLLGVIAGIAVGASPLGAVLYQPSSAAAAASVAQLPMELNACLGTCSPCQLASWIHHPLCAWLCLHCIWKGTQWSLLILFSSCEALNRLKICMQTCRALALR